MEIWLCWLFSTVKRMKWRTSQISTTYWSRTTQMPWI